MFNDQLPPEDFDGPILPVQYFESMKRPKLLVGEYRLLLAVLEDAVRCYLTDINGRSKEQRTRFAEVRSWFYSSGDTEQQALFAFESICDLLGINAGVVRKRLASISLGELPWRRLRWERPVARQRNHSQRRQHADRGRGFGTVAGM
jgi:hypothetical protein